MTKRTKRGNLLEQDFPENEEEGYTGAQNTQKPEGLPEKFWDEESRKVKLEELLEDYVSLTARDTNLVETYNRNIPESFEKYDIRIDNPLLARDDDVLRKLFEKKFTNEQAQLVYDLAVERVLPRLNEMAVDFEAQNQLSELTKYFGGQERFSEVSRQISNWAKRNVKPEVYDALATTSEGVIALYRMMSSKEPVIGKESDIPYDLTEDKLKQMMQDPRYWRDQDRAYIDKVTKGFEYLYSEK